MTTINHTETLKTLPPLPMAAHAKLGVNDMKRLAGILRDGRDLDPAVQIKPESTLMNDLALDSLDVLDLVLAINDAYAIRLSLFWNNVDRRNDDLSYDQVTVQMLWNAIQATQHNTRPLLLHEAPVA